MTKITIYKQNGVITKFECDGHTNFGVAGEDVVCAGVSSITQTAVLGVLMVAGVRAKLKRDEQKGYLLFELPKEMSVQESHDAQTILQTMLCGLCDLREGFSDFIELEVKD